MLELAKAVSFLICILSLYWAGISAFFVPGSQWEDRLWIAGFKLLAAAAICFYSGMVFSWPSKANPTAFQRLTATMPVRLFFWAGACIAVLFVLSWYLADAEAQAMSMQGFGLSSLIDGGGSRVLLDHYAQRARLAGGCNSDKVGCDSRESGGRKADGAIEGGNRRRCLGPQ